jgi:glucose dehydrogenase
MRRLTHQCLPFAVAAGVAVWIASAQPPKRVDDNALKNAAKNGDEWVTCGRDYAETHYSPLKQIDAANVSRLGLAWSWETERRRAAGSKARRAFCRRCAHRKV